MALEPQDSSIKVYPTYRKRVSTIILREGSLLSIKYKDPFSKEQFWGVPGGAVESGESTEEAGKRETLEETGYSITLDPSSEFMTVYPFFWGGKCYRCRTSWVRGRLIHPEIPPKQVHDADFIIDCSWIPLISIKEYFGGGTINYQAVSKMLEI